MPKQRITPDIVPGKEPHGRLPIVANGRVAKAVVRAWLYDRVLMSLTSGWYQEVLARLPNDASLLDVGIGTGSAVARSASVIRAKNIRILGLDIDPDYLSCCNKVLHRARLLKHVTPCLTSVYDHRGGPYDAVYFSASFMLLPDPVAAIKHVSSQLAPDGWVFFTQTFHHDKSPLIEKIKPMLHHFTTIHFGRVTYEDDFRQVMDDAGLELTELLTMGSTKRASYRLAMARPYPSVKRPAAARVPDSVCQAYGITAAKGDCGKKA
jgi:SAM-dependent methyltransferase